MSRATWIVTALDAGFATAGQIRWKWLRDIFSLLCAGYYLLFANEADEKVSASHSPLLEEETFFADFLSQILPLNLLFRL